MLLRPPTRALTKAEFQSTSWVLPPPILLLLLRILPSSRSCIFEMSKLNTQMLCKGLEADPLSHEEQHVKATFHSERCKKEHRAVSMYEREYTFIHRGRFSEVKWQNLLVVNRLVFSLGVPPKVCARYRNKAAGIHLPEKRPGNALWIDEASILHLVRRKPPARMQLFTNHWISLNRQWDVPFFTRSQVQHDSPRRLKPSVHTNTFQWGSLKGILLLRTQIRKKEDNPCSVYCWFIEFIQSQSWTPTHIFVVQNFKPSVRETVPDRQRPIKDCEATGSPLCEQGGWNFSQYWEIKNSGIFFLTNLLQDVCISLLIET